MIGPAGFARRRWESDAPLLHPPSSTHTANPTQIAAVSRLIFPYPPTETVDWLALHS